MRRNYALIVLGSAGVFIAAIFILLLLSRPIPLTVIPTVAQLPSLPPTEPISTERPQAAISITPVATSEGNPNPASGADVQVVVAVSTAQTATDILPTITPQPVQSPIPVAQSIVIPTTVILLQSSQVTPLPSVPPVIVSVPEMPVPDQLIIRFSETATQSEREAYIRSIGGIVKQEIAALDSVVVEVPEGTQAEALPASDVIAQMEPDYFVSALIDIPTSDPHYAEQWALPVIGAPEAWLALPPDAPTVAVAVIDSGICADHPDLQDRILSGYDFVENDETPQDEFGHGCGVSGIIAARIDNGVGIAGVAPNARIMPLRVLDAQGVGTYSNVAAAITYAADHGAQIINLSLGGAIESNVMKIAIDYALAKDITIVAAAGNTGREGVLYPAKYEGVIAVGSVDQNLERSSFSSYGTELDLWAPGRSILTLWNDGSYSTVSGTSYAAPIVTGIAGVEIAAGRSLNLGGIAKIRSAVASPVEETVILSPVPPITATNELLPVTETAVDFEVADYSVGVFQWSPLGNSVAFWQRNTLAGSPGIQNYDIILYNLDNGQRLNVAVDGNVGPMEFSPDGQKLWFWYNQSPFVVDTSTGVITPADPIDMPVELPDLINDHSESSSMFAASPPSNAISATGQYRIFPSNGELVLENRVTKATTRLTQNQEIENERVRLYALETPDTVVAQAQTANAFDFPICAPNFSGCYVAGSYDGTHPGHDMNGSCQNGGDCDLGWSVNAVANGRVVFSDYVGGGYTWGNIIMIEHTLPDGSKVWSQYAHLQTRSIPVNTDVIRGQQIGTIGKGHNNQFAAHLHFEMRTQNFAAYAWIYGGSQWQNYYTNPTNFINSHRQIGDPSSNCENYSYNGIVLFKDAQCESDKREFNTSGFRNIHETGFNDITSSIHVGSGWSVRIYEHDNRNPSGGGTRCITGSMWDLSVDRYDNSGPIINDTITSIDVYNGPNCSTSSPRNAVTLYKETNFNGDWCSLGSAGWANICNGYNDATSSIQVLPGWSVRVWANANREQPSRCFTGSYSNLSGVQYNENGTGNVDNSISSFEVFQQASCPPLVTAPSSPSHLSPSNGSTQVHNASITITWNSVSGATEYYAELTGGPYGTIARGWGSGTSWAIGDMWPGTYQWRVKARNSAGESSFSGYWTFQVRPAEPTNLSATTISQSQINLTWTATADASQIDGYRIYRNGSAIGTVTASTLSYQDTSGLSCGSSEFQYVVRAYKGGVESTDSNSALASTQPCGPNPPILSSPTTDEVLNTRSVTFQWENPNSPTQTGYLLRLSPHSSPTVTGWLVSVPLPSTTLSYNYTFASDGTYYWHMRTNGSSGNSSWVSQQIKIDTVSPTNIITSPQGNSFIATNEIVVQVSASDSNSGVARVQFWVGYDGALVVNGMHAQGDLSGTPLPADPSLTSAAPANVTAQTWEWHWIGQDTDSSDGWSVAWNAEGVPDQKISFYARAIDRAGNQQDISVNDIWLDRTLPSSTVDTLPPESPTSFTVSWAGTDAASGIASYDIEYQDNSGVWMQWLSATTSTSAVFTGTVDHTYGFRSRARDNAGNVEAWPASPDATTTVVESTNDDVDNALVISVLPYTNSQDTQTATTAVDDPSLVCIGNGGTHSVWYRFTPAFTGTVVMDTFTSTYDTVLAVWTGTRGSFQSKRCEDDYASSATSGLVLDVTAGTTYFIEVAGYDANSFGTLTLNVTQALFGDDFYKFNLSSWSARATDGGDLRVISLNSWWGKYVMRANIDDNTSIYVTDDRPTAEDDYYAYFRFDPNTIRMSNGDTHVIFYGYQGTSTAILSVEFRRYNNRYQLRPGLLTDSGSTWRRGTWSQISDDWHFIELYWYKSSAMGANSGGLAFWIDGVQRANLTGIDNDTRRLDRIRLGAVSGIDGGTRGSYYFDEFVSFRPEYLPAETISATALAESDEVDQNDRFVVLEAQTVATFTPSPTLTATPTALPLMIVESDNAAVQHSQNWMALTNPSGTSGGSYLVNTVPDETLTMWFAGSHLELAYVTSPSFGRFVVEIDGVAVQEVDSSSPETASIARIAISTLAEGQHTVVVRPLNSVVGIDAFYIHGTVLIPTVAPTPTVDEMPTATLETTSTPEIVVTDVPPTELPTNAEVTPSVEPTQLPTDVAVTEEPTLVTPEASATNVPPTELPVPTATDMPEPTETEIPTNTPEPTEVPEEKPTEAASEVEVTESVE